VPCRPVGGRRLQWLRHVLLAGQGEALAAWITGASGRFGIFVLSPARFGPVIGEARVTVGTRQYADDYDLASVR
jgi:hypothetical protein